MILIEVGGIVKEAATQVKVSIVKAGTVKAGVVAMTHASSDLDAQSEDDARASAAHGAHELLAHLVEEKVYSGMLLNIDSRQRSADNVVFESSNRTKVEEVQDREGAVNWRG